MSTGTIFPVSPKQEKAVRIDVSPVGIESAIICDSFGIAFESLTREGYNIISLPQNAQLRIQQGEHAYVSGIGNWTREGVLYIPNKKPRLIRNSPIFKSVSQAIKAHKAGKEFYPSEIQIEQALENSIELPTENIRIPTNSFGCNNLTIYAFGGKRQARTYGEFLEDVGTKEMPVEILSDNYANKQKKPFVRQVWFNQLASGSGIYGNRYIGFGTGHWLRGIKIKTISSNGSKIPKDWYSRKSILRVLEDLELSGLQKIIFEKLN